jgi:hypothetical protein
MKQGHGSLLYAKHREVYKGEFKQNKREGFGTIYDELGNTIFVGKFKNDKPVNS